MKTPQVFIAYAPRGAGLRCVLAYLVAGRDVYGWYTGPRLEGTLVSEFFGLEQFYSTHTARYSAVDVSDLHANWALGEARRHELAQMQEMFVREWLVYRDDPRAAVQREAYAEAELAAGEVMLRFDRLAKLSKLQPNWTFYSPGFERSVLRHLAKRWRLEYSFELAEAA